MKWMFLPIVMLFYLGILVSLNAQPTYHSVMAAGGGFVEEEKTVVLPWTRGELAVRTLPTSGGLLTEGFHQPILSLEQVASNINEELGGQVQLLVAPNLVRSIFCFKIHSELEGKAVIDLWTLRGRLLKRTIADLSQVDMQWDITPFP